MAATVTPPSTVSPKMTCAGSNVQKWQPRDEHLRLPRKNLWDRASSTRTLPGQSITLPRGPPPSRRESSDSLQDPDSPKVVDFQASAGAEVGRKTHHHHGSYRTSHETTRSGRHSEVSNVLEYYLCDQSPLQSPLLSSTPNVRPKDPAIAAFDFDLTPRTPVSQPPEPQVTKSDTRSDIKSSTNRCLGTMSASATSTYSLFPNSRYQNMDPSIQPSNLYSNNAQPSLSQAPQGISIHPIRPRKASLPLFVRSRADSCTSIQLLPSATITLGHPIPPSSGEYPRRPIPTHVTSSMPTSPPTSQGTRVSTPTRWSGDTISHPLESPSVKERSSTSSSNAWPQTGSFFEDDDDDEEVPLRKKVAIRIRGTRAWSSSSTATSESTIRPTTQQRKGWSRWMTCCGRRK